MPPIDARAVLELARVLQQDWIDLAAAGRIAAGASAATAAVAAAAPWLDAADAGLLTDDAADFRATLEALAEPCR